MTIEMTDEVMSTTSDGPFTAVRALPAAAKLVAVRAGRHKNFDRLVFEFAGPIPGYDFSYVPEVYRGESGEVLPLRGRAPIQARFEPCNAHDNAGNSTAPTSVSVKDFAMLRQVTLAEDFEAVVIYGIGTAEQDGGDLTELTSPDRLVLDLAHAQPGTGNELLKKGSKGAGVATWQWRLVQALGQDLRVDEDFGPKTEQATKTFQTKRHITADGVVGPITRAKMEQVLGI